MPRKNNIKPHVPYAASSSETGKRRFASKRQAEEVATEQMLLKPELTLYVYKGIDGGWYLTRKQK
jgi:hypothetical protein